MDPEFAQGYLGQFVSCGDLAAIPDSGFCFLSCEGLTGLSFPQDFPCGPLRSLGFATGQKWLAGRSRHEWALGGDGVVVSGPFHILQGTDIEAGYASLPVTADQLESSSQLLYAALLQRVQERHLYRVWNFVPAINQVTPPLIENYRLFCSGRAMAFAEAAANPDANTGRLPAASATGCHGNTLTIAYIAGDIAPVDWENPEQTPAYQYPEAYGPHAPSFSRATSVILNGHRWLFISGTAAIKGSVTQMPFQFAGQLEVTMENLDLVLRSTQR